jgi:hypothetical protein
VAEHVDMLELCKAGLGDHLQRLAGRIREEVEVERLRHQNALWISMWEALP